MTKGPKKPPGKSKKAAPTAPSGGAKAPDERRAARNVEHIKGKLAAALDDPHMREQIVRAMRSLINEDKT